ncbi:glycerate kinase [Lacrimispora saccharolytica]|nr:glycerate kinase [Lachnospiraceae bacterium]MDM8248568.1 glycerate kinase [Lacrimispora saccharolytica]
MKKVIIIPDSFKGTLSAKQICRILKEKVHQQFPACEVVTVPVADGGEGSVDCFLEALGGRKETVQVHGPYMELMEAEYGILSDGTAVVEMASCAGLPLVEDRKNPKKTTTYGVGELILAAAKAGSKRIITGLGGSCTNDGGCGMAAALGIRFYDAQDREFVPTGGTLKEIRRIDMSRREKLLDQIELLAMCDITNPLTGPEGAAHVFSPQKGADEGMIQELEAGMVHYASILEQTVQIPKIRELPGGGAAGGMGTGMAALLGAKLIPGIQAVLDTVQIDTLAEHADLILTGEGKIDSQSIHGKVLSGIARRGKALGIPVVAIAGGIDREALPELYRDGLTAAFSINQLPEDFSVSRGKSMENLETEMENLLRLIAAFPANS